MTKLFSVATSLSDLEKILSDLFFKPFISDFLCFLQNCLFIFNSVICYLPIKSDTSSMDLDSEEKRHSGETSNKCNKCEYTCSSAGDLRTHLKTHSGEKPNKCSQCDYASSQAGHLRTHMIRHSGEKSNKCNQCDYASSNAGDLRRHLKTHSEEKSPAACVTLHPQMQTI